MRYIWYKLALVGLLASWSIAATIHFWKIPHDTLVIGPDHDLESSYWSSHKVVTSAAADPKVPLILPGPADIWAGGDIKEVHLQLAQSHNARIKLDFADSHESGPPELEITSNGKVLTKFRVEKGSGQHPEFWEEKGKPSSHSFVVNSSDLGSDNTLVLKSLHGSWVGFSMVTVQLLRSGYDYIALYGGWGLTLLAATALFWRQLKAIFFGIGEGVELHWAILSNDDEKASALLDGGADVNARADVFVRRIYLDVSPLHAAVLRGNESMAKKLISAGAVVDSLDGSGATPLHMATRSNSTSMVHILMDAGANPDVIDYSGYSPLRRAIEEGANEALAALLDRGANKEDMAELLVS